MAMISVVPMGDVDSRMTRLPGASRLAMRSTAVMTQVMSGWLAPSIGVGTAIMNTSAASGCSCAVSVPFDTTFCTRPSRSGSAMWIEPDATVFTMFGLMSMPMTFMPRLAISAAVGKPM